MQQRAKHLGAFDSILPVVAETRDDPGLIVIAPIQAVPSVIGQLELPCAQNVAQVRRLDGLDIPLRGTITVNVHMLEMKYHVEFAPCRIGIELSLIGHGSWRLADRHQLGIVKHALAQLMNVLVNLRPIGAPGIIRPEAIGIGWGRSEFGPFGYEVDDVHTEPVDPAPKPEPDDLVDVFPNFGILPIQVRLLLREQVQIVLPDLVVPLPGTAPERRAPVVRHLSRRRCILPDVEVPVRPGIRGDGPLEPLVLIGGVVDHQIEHDADIESMRFGHQLIEILQRPELRLYLFVVRYVVAVVDVRRLIDRVEPDRIDAELGDIGQLLLHPTDVANAVGVGILETPRVDLIDNRPTPPFLAFRPCLRRPVDLRAFGCCPTVLTHRLLRAMSEHH